MRSPDLPPCHSDALVLLVGCDPERKGELPWPTLAALAAADVVLHDRAVDPATLAQVPPRCLVEPVAEADGTARARRLAADGWRVVRLVIGEPDIAEAARLGAAGVRTGILAGPAQMPAAAALAPQPLATALNGLAG